MLQLPLSIDVEKLMSIDVRTSTSDDIQSWALIHTNVNHRNSWSFRLGSRPPEASPP
ncbi:hypothetical protein DY000_02030927 [Brassica cretica]|uniref:Uncharacterized protein n=1 Tax=Brassica cretica TaxID=69181 RepID=A0ABQ7DPB3_BRACR|nr:hypothetical protein DY000_02030927 [Brassica cretica]